MTRSGFAGLGVLALTLAPQIAHAASSAELYTAAAYGYGRYEARVKFAGGDGVISSFFMWKDGSEKAGTFWNELDFEKVGADCHLETNPLYGNPSAVHPLRHGSDAKACDTFHVYTYEWTPEYISWLLDGVELRRETGDTAKAYADNASAAGMQIHFNIWPGDATFGGTFSPTILPVHQYIDWIQFSGYADGAFTLSWREDFNGTTLASNWLMGSWGSPKNLSTHDTRNVNLLNGCAVLSLTADDATGTAGAVPCDGDAGGPGTGGAVGSAGSSSSAAGSGTSGGGTSPSGSGGSPTSGNAPSSMAGTTAAGSNGNPGAVPPSSASSSIGACSLVAPIDSRPPWAAFGVLGLAVLFRRSRSRRG